ncbi:hypothetical protein [Symbiopectobacterium purcellii]|uniref:Phage ABA sandwich domain-containing protein n=1 Tax=Symbiopectobacterium purcellii TaxID=2871826 RepID=A0ABX9ARZ3_9ENTR|nr:hypothetical protein [Symbiopectobacterium purcellii]QZN97808.1 hypothetical protein K6K13_11180 [Symbiopectobacterium purcellii]
MSTEQMRIEFEEWANNNGWSVRRGTDLCYVYERVDLMWSAWLASRAALVVELPEGDLVYSTATDTYGEDGCVMLPVDTAIHAIRAAGITVKEGGCSQDYSISSKKSHAGIAMSKCGMESWLIGSAVRLATGARYAQSAGELNNEKPIQSNTRR